MNFRGGEFSTGEMRNFHPALTYFQTGRLAGVPTLCHYTQLDSPLVRS
jgi:hypothetical protein